MRRSLATAMGEYLFIGSAIFSAVNGALLLNINPRRLINRILFLVSIWIALWHVTVVMAIREGGVDPSVPNPTLLFWLRSSSVIGAYLMWWLWVMRETLISDAESIWRVLRRSWLSFLIASGTASITFSGSFIAPNSTSELKIRGTAYLIYSAILAGYCLWSVFDVSARARRLHGIRRIEMQFFVLGTVLACLFVVTSNAFGNLLHTGWLRRTGPIWFTLSHSCTIWALCYYRIFDAKHIILSVGQRLGLLLFLGWLAYLAVPQIAQVTGVSWGLVLVAGVLCLVAISTDLPLRRLLGLDAEHSQSLPRKEVIEYAKQFPNEEQLVPRYESLLTEICKTEDATLMPLNDNTFKGRKALSLTRQWRGFAALCKDGWITPESLQRRKSACGTAECITFLDEHRLGALLAIPRGSHTPSLIVALGIKSSLRPYTFPDLQLLLGLSELMDNILTHSRVSAHAARLERMAAASMISRGLAHDLNNLAAPISAFLIYNEARVQSGTLEATVLADAKNALQAMQEYIRESLFFSRQLSPAYRELSARSLVETVTRLLSKRASAAGIGLVAKVNEDFTFWGDEALLLRSMQNLVLNAIDASRPDANIEIGASVGLHEIAISVADLGVGIPSELRDQIFEPYFTTKNSGTEHRGFGLGLAIARKIAELHDGRIRLSPNTPSGSIFEFVLPKHRPTRDLFAVGDSKNFSLSSDVTVEGASRHI